jgi:DNA-binding LytR/AlgR family response regulator
MQEEVLQGIILEEFKPKEAICVISKGRVASISIIEITRLSKLGNCTLIHTKDAAYPTRDSLRSIMEDLPVNEFVHVHRSHVVAINRIESVNDVEMIVDDIVIPITEYYRGELLRILKRILERNYYLVEKAKSS